MTAFVLSDRPCSPGPAVASPAHSMRLRADCPVADLRSRFIAAADRVLANHGFTNFKVREVCRQARLSTHCFYEVFDSKDELLAAMLENQFRVASDYLQRIIDPGLPPVDRVWAYVEAMVDFGFDQRLDRAFALFAMYWRALLPHYRDLTERSVKALLAPLVDAIAEGEAGGVIRSPDPAADAMAIYFLITALFFDRPAHVVQREEMETTVRRFVARALDLK